MAARRAIEHSALQLVPKGGAWSGTHPKARFTTRVDAAGAEVEGQGGAFRLGLHVASVGRPGALRAIDATTVHARGEQVAIERGEEVTEWFAHVDRGLEHGVDLARRPRGEGELLARVEVDGLTPVAHGAVIDLCDSVGAAVLSYGELSVEDAEGHKLDARLDVAGSAILVHIADDGARYPLHVDPLVWTPEGTLRAPDPSIGSGFGWTVAMNGTTAIVGAAQKTVGTNSQQGAAYLFTASQGVWTLQRELVAPDGIAGDQFGSSVALSGTAAIVGAKGRSSNQGAAYIYSLSGGALAAPFELTPPDHVANGSFGTSVAIDDLGGAVVGASGSPYAQVGGAYVFLLSAGTWKFQQKLRGGDTAPGDAFGAAVSTWHDGALVFVTAPEHTVGTNVSQGAVYVFSGTISGWSQVAELVVSSGKASDRLGVSVAFDPVSSLAIVGAQGANAAYLFGAVSGSWGLTATLTPTGGGAGEGFGDSVALSGNLAVVGAPTKSVGLAAQQGAAYTFVKSGTTWTQQSLLVAPDGAAGDLFGIGVAASGTTVLVGAPYSKQGTTLYAGGGYLFDELNATEVVATDGAANDALGARVSISGNLAIVGAPLHSLQRGVAYIFARGTTGWTLQAELTDPMWTMNDMFGSSVAISGTTAVVGAPGYNVGHGAAYVYVQTGTTWSKRETLRDPLSSPSQWFGASVAVDGTTVVVGKPNNGRGAAYVYLPNGTLTLWSLQSTLSARDGVLGDTFGASLALSGKTLLVGAPHKLVSGSTSAGAVYVFTGAGTTWTLAQEIDESTVGADDLFGTSVALSGATAIVGASGWSSGRGAAYVYLSGTGGFMQIAQLMAADGAVADGFGTSVGISGNLAIVGAPHGTMFPTVPGQGTAYLFAQSGTKPWTETSKLSAADVALAGAEASFGASVAISGTTELVGAPGSSVGTSASQGTAYFFQ